MDVTRLAIVVDASGARREIQLTTEELKRLANGGAQAQAVFNNTVPRAITQTATAAHQGSMSLNRFQNVLGNVAISAGAIPGPLGRVASAISQFAIGGFTTVGVLAGLAAISLAWEKITESARAAAKEQKAALERLADLQRKQQWGPAGQTGADVRTARGRLDQLTFQIAEQYGYLGTATPTTRGVYLGQIQRLQEEYRRIEAAVRAGEAEITRIMREEAEKRATTKQRLAPYVSTEIDVSYAMQAMAARARQQAEAAALDARLRALVAFNPNFSVGDTSISPTGGLAQTLAALGARNNKWKAVGAAGVGLTAMSGMPFSGAIAGMGGAALMGAGPWGIAAAGVTGLAEGLMSLANEGARAKEAMRQFQAAMSSFIGNMEVELGLRSSGSLAAEEARRAIDERKRALEGIILNPGTAKADRDRAIADWQRLTALSEDYVKLKKEEADQLERYNAIVRNAPRGFFVEKYLRDLGVPSSGSGPTFTPGHGPGPDRRATTSIGRVNIEINGVADPMANARAVLTALQTWAQATNGDTADLATAWATLPVS